MRVARAALGHLLSARRLRRSPAFGSFIQRTSPMLENETTMRVLPACVVFFLGWHPSVAQSISVGLNGGFRATKDVTEGIAVSESKPYVVGPALELGLPLGLGIEFDALYHREGYRSHSLAGGGLGYENVRERSSSWEFPLLLKYEPRLSALPIRPFIEAGYAWRTMPASYGISGFLPIGGGLFEHQFRTNLENSSGFVVGGGVRFGVGRFGFAPRLRYTHWRSGTGIADHTADGFSINSTQNQIDIMVGIDWKVRRTR